MPFKSSILAGSPRLDQAAAGGPAVKPAPPPDNPDAVRRIQKALVALGFPLPLSFPNGPNPDPDGKYGQETFTAVIAFQRKAFPTDPSQWDGRVGKNTLAKMDAMLPAGAAPPVVPPATMSALAEKDKATSIQWAQAAVRSLTAARQTLQSLSGGSTIPGLPPILPPAFRLTFDALEAHFHISTAAVSQIAFIDAVIAIYQKVLTLLSNSRAFFV
uniref:peptidoglycan-binding domain-containing protein n=1 Tax=Desulfococcus sp. TaxID=2025834 RepID=UPI003593EFCB